MTSFDETDLEILELLLSDARRPWSDIAESVDLSPPAVADRVERLRDAGVIRRFTADLDRSQLRAGVTVFVRIDPVDGTESLRETLAAAEAVEHVFTTASARLLCVARVPDGDVPAWLAATVAEGEIADFDVELLTETAWTPSLGGTDVAIACAECGNTVTSEGETARLEGDLYHFCCGSCETQFTERFERMAEGAD